MSTLKDIPKLQMTRLSVKRKIKDTKHLKEILYLHLTGNYPEALAFEFKMEFSWRLGRICLLWQNLNK